MMKCIKKASEIILKILGEQSVKQMESVHFASWCVATTADCGILLLNNFTKELILIGKDEGEFLCVSDLSGSDIDSIRDSNLFDYLVKNWFIVPEWHDDLKLIDEVREVVACMNQPDGITSYVILTTTDCNARCFYCFEQGLERVNMSRKIALDTVEFIKKTAGKEVQLRWFGGEPLFNIAVIDIITDELMKAGIKFWSEMVSNGYLATDNVIKKAVESWNLKRIQITLDGTEEVYNERKAYVNSKGSAFQRVLDNIEKLLKAGISVAVRLNVDMDNAEDLHNLSDLLDDRFSIYENFIAYAHYIFDGETADSLSYSFEDTFVEHMKLNSYLSEKGLSHRNTIEKMIKTNRCMADNDYSIVVTPVGDLYKCETIGTTDKCGTIYTGVTDQKIVNQWKKKADGNELCEKCPMYVDCIKLVACPFDFNYCPQIIYDDSIRNLKNAMLYTYETEMKK